MKTMKCKYGIHSVCIGRRRKYCESEAGCVLEADEEPDEETDKEDVVEARVCKICGKQMQEGFYCDGDYYCSKECMDNDPNYSYEQYLEDYDNGDEVYWTDWR